MSRVKMIKARVRKPKLTPKGLTKFLAGHRYSLDSEELLDVLAKTTMIILAWRARSGTGLVYEMKAFHHRVLRAATDNFLRKGK
jgi:hypothetical protein